MCIQQAAHFLQEISSFLLEVCLLPSRDASHVMPTNTFLLLTADFWLLTSNKILVSSDITDKITLRHEDTPKIEERRMNRKEGNIP